MALIAEEHPKFLETPNPKLRLDIWEETLEKVPFELAEIVIKRLLTESHYQPKLADVVQGVKGEITARKLKMDKENLQIRSWKHLHKHLGIKLPPDIFEKCYGKPLIDESANKES